MGRNAKRYYTAILIGIAASAVIGLLVVGRIPQDPAYHLFADSRTIAGVRNFWNTWSNLPFLLIGLYGTGLKKEGKNEGAEAVVVRLAVEFLGAKHLGPSQLALLEIEGCSAC